MILYCLGVSWASFSVDQSTRLCKVDLDSSFCNSIALVRAANLVLTTGRFKSAKFVISFEFDKTGGSCIFFLCRKNVQGSIPCFKNAAISLQCSLLFD